MFMSIAGLTTKVVVGAAAVALTGAGAVATMSATAPASASTSNAVGGSSAGPISSSSTPEATVDATPEATREPGDDNGVDATNSPTPSQDDVAVTRDQAIAIAQARFPQGALHEVELESEDGTVVWKVDLRAVDGSRAKIWVDASTGTIVRERFKDAKNQTPRPSASPRDDRDDDHSNSGRGSDDHANSGRDGSGRDGDDNPSSSDSSGQDDNGSNSGHDGSDD